MIFSQNFNFSIKKNPQKCVISIFISQSKHVTHFHPPSSFFPLRTTQKRLFDEIPGSIVRLIPSWFTPPPPITPLPAISQCGTAENSVRPRPYSVAARPTRLKHKLRHGIIMPFIRKRDATRFVATPGTTSRDELFCTTDNKRDRVESGSRSRKKNDDSWKMPGVDWPDS